MPDDEEASLVEDFRTMLESSSVAPTDASDRPKVCSYVAERFELTHDVACRVAWLTIERSLTLPADGSPLDAHLLAARLLLALDPKPSSASEKIPGLDRPASDFAVDTRPIRDLKWENSTQRREFAAAALGMKTRRIWTKSDTHFRETAQALEKAFLSLLQDESEMRPILDLAKAKHSEDQEGQTNADVRRRTVLRLGVGLLALGAVGAAMVRVVSRDQDSEASDNAPIKVVQRLDISGFNPMVLASAVQIGMPTDMEGCLDVAEIPQEWDGIAQFQEVMFHIKPRRDDITLTGFEIDRLTHSELGPRVALTCMGGGNGAPSGFTIRDTDGGVKIIPTGAGVFKDRMQLALDPREGVYRIAAWFESETERITEWQGAFLFQFGPDGKQTYRLPTGRIRTAGVSPEVGFLEAKDGRWQSAPRPVSHSIH